MDANVPASDPQRDLVENSDLSDVRVRSAIFELAAEQILRRTDLLCAINRLDPSKFEEVILVYGLLVDEVPYNFLPQELEVFAAKIDPNTPVGSFAARILVEEKMMSTLSYDTLKQRVDPSKIKLGEKPSETGTTIENLIGIGLIELSVPQSVLSRGLDRPFMAN